MSNYADRLISAIKTKGNPCVIGLDPRLEMMPDAFVAPFQQMAEGDAVRAAIANFNRTILDIVSSLVPAVKLQIAFYEQYGLPGLQAFEDTICAARERGLVIIVDAKRNDISSTAQAYANAFLGRSSIFGKPKRIFDVDCITVSPFLGRDSLLPFVNTCAEYGKGIFILVKTSNHGSRDLQDQKLINSEMYLYEKVAMLVDDLGSNLIGESGYSSIGAVIGATFPEEARLLRKMIPHGIVLVPGYGAQGGTAMDAVACFNRDGLGAVVNASRSITYAHKNSDVSIDEFKEIVRVSAIEMVKNLTDALQEGLKMKHGT